MILSYDKSTHLQYPSALYHGIEDEAKLFLSTRLMLLTAIAETSLQGDVARRLIDTLTSLQLQEQKYHIANKEVFGQTITDTLKTYQQIKDLLVLPDDRHITKKRW